MTNVLTREENILKVHLAPDGDVWFLDGKRAPTPFEGGIEAFTDPNIIAGRELRVLGTHENAMLICKLYEMRLKGAIQTLQLAGPLVCDSVAERMDPEKALFRMRQCVLPGSVGGWHTMTEWDYPTYAIIAQLRRDSDTSEHTRHLMQAHPAWKDLQFIETLHIDAVTILVALIADPRYFIDVAHPNRLGKLIRYLGLNPKVQGQIHEANCEDRPYHNRCRSVLDSWWAGDKIHSGPRNFLYRIWQHYGGGIRGEVRASQAFATYLRYTWLHRMTSHAASAGEGLFDAALFFKNDDEVAAYNAFHAQSS